MSKSSTTNVSLSEKNQTAEQRRGSQSSKEVSSTLHCKTTLCEVMNIYHVLDMLQPIKLKIFNFGFLFFFFKKKKKKERKKIINLMDCNIVT